MIANEGGQSRKEFENGGKLLFRSTLEWWGCLEAGALDQDGVEIERTGC